MTPLPGSPHHRVNPSAPVTLADAANAEGEALTQADQIAAETLIRTTAQSLANGAPVRDLDDVVRRNARRPSREDIRSNRLGSSVLGDIIGAVEQAKGNTNINWNSATPQQISAYMIANGLSTLQVQRLLGGGKAEAEREARGGDARRGTSSIDYGSITGNFGLDRNGTLSGFTTQMFNSQFRPIGYNEPTARGVATILGQREGLSGEALVRRTKEVGRDTKDRLGLDVNTYAPKIARMGKEYSEPIIGDKALLDEAARLANSGQIDEANKVMERYKGNKRQLIERAQQNKPDVVPDIQGTYHGLENNLIQKAPMLKPGLSDTRNMQTIGPVTSAGPVLGDTAQLSAAGANQDFFAGTPPTQALAPPPIPGAAATADAAAAPKPDAKGKDETATKEDKAVKSAALLPKSAVKPAKPSGVG